ncbi:32348_t:CDS:2 [Gigaspora margarita]|uniref:32348_t:CDS:1 n=1 Tax=Gigaspora margarita TaxID=4874 RepID=A0ABN7V357_GIGMA|nr:32348_t:CDS:2 [Gigaspora margarita]
MRLFNITLFSTLTFSQNASSNFTTAANNVTAVSGFIVKGYTLISKEIPLSSTCQSRLAQMYNSTDINTCIPYISLSSLLSQSNIVPDSMSLYNAICSLERCTDTFISSTLSSFKIDCTSDLISNNSAVFGVELLFTFYTPLINSYCYKNSTGGSCVLKYREDYTTFAGAGVSRDNTNPLNFTVLPDITNVPSSIVCTNCVKAMANTFLDYLDSNPGDYSILGTTQTGINNRKDQYTAKCGSSFLDGSIPDTTSPILATSSPSPNSNVTSNHGHNSNVFDNPLYRGLIIGGCALAVLLIIASIVGCCIYIKSKYPNKTKIEYIPTPGTNAETREVAADI